MTRRHVPVLRIDRWEEQDIPDPCPHPHITRFVGSCNHVAYRCLYCDVRFDITPHVYPDPQ